MRLTVVISAKIQDKFYAEIQSGRKRFEVRSEDFQDAAYIRYISSLTGRQLGVWSINSTFTISSSDRSALYSLTAVDKEFTDKEFPVLPVRLIHVARLGNEVTLNDIFPREES
ncbi:hypothetical protein EJ419_05580 [Alloscardovia theropitheci]|uniref:DUF3850 domain-containing protein n=1 Tax=Alloscardovia theropitheci TaxID=2496842 RepID=A0A4R0QPH6_9BIFI|nr:hypothetical protein [Alloscardovia theropitheci]TCD54122.1 hypothetical protein EJ419_05580 [Alloscardovia theropitheci]